MSDRLDTHAIRVNSLKSYSAPFNRYGSLHGSVLGVEAVLADGTIVNLLNTNRKDNTGIDLKHLFIGSEGILGILTKVTIKLAPKPVSVNAAWMRISGGEYETVLRLLRLSRDKLGEILSAFELVDNASLKLTLPILKERTSSSSSLLSSLDDEDSAGKEKSNTFNVLMETHGSNEEHDMDKLMGFVNDAMEEGLIVEDGGIIAMDQKQLDSLWSVRESITESLAIRARESGGRVFKYDFSIPVGKLYDLVTDTRQRMMALAPELCADEKVLVVGYGHMGDGNLHLNVLVRSGDPADVRKVEQVIEPFVYEWTSMNGGSISAEHGVGMLKSPYLHLNKSQEAIAMMAGMKAMMDPKCILNPYKVLPHEYIVNAYEG